MSLIKNIKLNYYIKLFDQLLSEKKFNELTIEILNQYNKKNPYLREISAPYISHILNNFGLSGGYKPKMVWLNSFYKSDLKQITNFLKFYLPQTLNDDFVFADFSEEAIKVYEQLEFSKNTKITFEDFIELNDFFQFFINNSSNKIIFLENNNAFYEQPSRSKFFLYTNTTKCYLYLIKNPFEIYHEMKLQHEKEYALNSILFLDQQNQNCEFHDKQIEENSNSWPVNVNSWTNENVINTFNGLIIKNEDYQKDPLNFFAEIIAHLKMSGLDIKLDYEKIEQYINNQNTNQTIHALDISNKTKKMFDRDCAALLKKFNYDI